MCMRAGPERLKEALAALGMKTGGTVRQRAERLFLTRDTPLEQIDRKHFAKGSAPAALRSAEERQRVRSAAAETALLEAKVCPAAAAGLQSCFHGLTKGALLIKPEMKLRSCLRRMSMNKNVLTGFSVQQPEFAS